MSLGFTQFNPEGREPTEEETLKKEVSRDHDQTSERETTTERDRKKIDREIRRLREKREGAGGGGNSSTPGEKCKRGCGLHKDGVKSNGEKCKRGCGLHKDGVKSNKKKKTRRGEREEEEEDSDDQSDERSITAEDIMPEGSLGTGTEQDTVTAAKQDRQSGYFPGRDKQVEGTASGCGECQITVK